MTPTVETRRSGAVARTVHRLRAALCAIALGIGAQTGVLAASDPVASWESLSAGERQVLEPLSGDWPRIDPAARQKWLKLAERFPSLEPKDQVRIRARMAEWSGLSPNDRARARQQFLDSREWPARDRQERWQAYQALTPEQRQALAQSAAQAASTPLGPRGGPTGAMGSAVPPAGPSTPARTGSVTAVQVKPGATTQPLTVRTAPPPHQQPGMPKIAATPAFVDPATLLPRRGPQAAAMQAAAASAGPERSTPR